MRVFEATCSLFAGTFVSNRKTRPFAGKHLITGNRLRDFDFSALSAFFYADVIDAIRWLASKMPTLNQSMSVEEPPMRDSMFMLAPVGLIIYFLIYPDQFHAFLAWAGQYLR